MKASLLSPLKSAATIRMTYNGKQFFSQDFAAGESPSVEVQQPRVPGVGKIILVIDGKEIPMGSCTYSAANVASLLMSDAKELEKNKQPRKARSCVKRAVKLLEKGEPCEKLADAYLNLCFSTWFARGRKATRTQRQLEGIAWYEKAISVYEKLDDPNKLAGNLINMSVLYNRMGDHETALARCLRGFEIEKKREKFDDESIAAWTHTAGCYLHLGKLDDAERIIADGLKTFGENTPNCGYLYGLQARVFEARAKLCREKAEAILPPQHCSL